MGLITERLQDLNLRGVAAEIGAIIRKAYTAFQMRHSHLSTVETEMVREYVYPLWLQKVMATIPIANEDVRDMMNIEYSLNYRAEITTVFHPKSGGSETNNGVMKISIRTNVADTATLTTIADRVNDRVKIMKKLIKQKYMKNEATNNRSSGHVTTPDYPKQPPQQRQPVNDNVRRLFERTKQLKIGGKITGNNNDPRST